MAESLFDDVTVLDLSTFVTGGFASLMLANQGADVIKIEQPEIGDDIRHSGPPFIEPTTTDHPGITPADRGESPYFWTVNYGKRSAEINLQTDAGLTALYDLVTEADVFIENFRPGTADRLGVGYDDISEANDRIVYCSISAFGDSGPWRLRPGYDMLVQGTSGIMSVTGPEDGDPVKVGVAITDLITAMWSAFGIAGALRRRDMTGRGERIELGMLDAALPWLTKQAGVAFAGEKPVRLGTKDPVVSPYQAYETADSYLIVGCGNQKLWSELCDAIDRQDLIDDPRFASNADRVDNRDALEAELTAVFDQRTTSEWVDFLGAEHNLPVSPVHDVAEALSNEQTEARGVMSEVDHPAVGSIPVIDHPLNFDHVESGFDGPPPLLGEHTETVLREIGYSDADIDHLKQAGGIPDR